MTFTILPKTEVIFKSKTQECELPTTSIDTIGSSVYCTIPLKRARGVVQNLICVRNAVFIDSKDYGFNTVIDGRNG